MSKDEKINVKIKVTQDSEVKLDEELECKAIVLAYSLDGTDNYSHLGFSGLSLPDAYVKTLSLIYAIIGGFIEGRNISYIDVLDSLARYSLLHVIKSREAGKNSGGKEVESMKEKINDAETISDLLDELGEDA